VATESHDRYRTSKKNSSEDMKYLKRLEEEVSAWPKIAVHAHRFGGREFRFGSAEVGHLHEGGVVDIPFPRPVRDALLAESLTEEHRSVPNSGWTTFHVGSEHDFKHAVWHMRLSYLLYALKTAADPRSLLDQQSEELHLSPHFRSLLERAIPPDAIAGTRYDEDQIRWLDSEQKAG
jgi:Family of unknown function (DUF5519)